MRENEKINIEEANHYTLISKYYIYFNKLIIRKIILKMENSHADSTGMRH